MHPGIFNCPKFPCEGRMLNGRPFEDATSQNANQQCSNVDAAFQTNRVSRSFGP